MVPLLSSSKTIEFALAACAGLLATAAAAAPVSLRYDFSAMVTSTAYFHDCYNYEFDYDDYDLCADFEADGFATTYEGPPLGSRGTGALTVTFDPESEYYGLDLFLSTSFPELFAPQELQAVTGYDPATQAISLWSFNYYDQFQISLDPETARGVAEFDYEPNASGANFAQVDLRLYDVTVTDLSAPVPAPVPLPAALPLLGAGLAGLGFLRRRRA